MQELVVSMRLLIHEVEIFRLGCTNAMDLVLWDVSKT
jgi:hypothetical protein